MEITPLPLELLLVRQSVRYYVTMNVFLNVFYKEDWALQD